MVEAAIVTPLVFFVLMALMDAGLYFGQSLSLQYAARGGARAASVAGADGLADYDVLKAVNSGLVFVPNSRITRVVVYRAATWNDKPSTSCMAGIAVSGGGIGSCNVYTMTDAKRPTTDFGVGGWTGDDSYPGWLRNNHRGQADYVGVWITSKSMTFTKILAANDVVTNNAVVRIEARQL